MKKTTLITIGALLVASSALAFNGSDNFNDNSRDTGKWSTSSTRLTETSSRLEYASADSGDHWEKWTWIGNNAAYTENWSAEVDVYSALDPSGWGVDEETGFGVQIENGSDSSDRFEIAFAVGNSEGSTFRELYSLAATNGMEIGEVLYDMGSSNSVTLRISFDATTKVLSSAYDIGSGYIGLTNFNVTAWGMGVADVFDVNLLGFSEGKTIASGDIYGDNFAAVPEPASVMMIGLGGLVIMGYRRIRKSYGL